MNNNQQPMNNNMKTRNVADAMQSVKEAVAAVLVKTTSQVNKIQLQRLGLIKELKSSKDRVSNIEKELLEIEEFVKWTDGVQRGVNSLHSQVSQAPCKKAVEQGVGIDYPYTLAEAAERGDAWAQYELGKAYYYGPDMMDDPEYDGVEDPDYDGVKDPGYDPAEGVKWFRRAAEQGHADAQYKLGFAYHVGSGVKENKAEAVTWYRQAAKQGSFPAQYQLIELYRNSIGVVGADCPCTLAEAAEWGDAEAQYNLGVAYADGVGVAKDPTEGLKWIRKSAEQGIGRAQLSLGVAYWYGSGVPEDPVEAVKWFQKAAEQGIGRAQEMMGAACRTGKGVAKNEAMAVYWYRLAEE